MLTVITSNKLQPVLETLDQLFRDLFEQERGREIFEIEIKYMGQLAQGSFEDLLKLSPNDQRGLFANVVNSMRDCREERFAYFVECASRVMQIAEVNPRANF